MGLAGLSEYFLLLLLLRRDKSAGLFNRTHTVIILFAQSIRSFLPLFMCVFRKAPTLRGLSYTLEEERSSIKVQ